MGVAIISTGQGGHMDLGGYITGQGGGHTAVWLAFCMLTVVWGWYSWAWERHNGAWGMLTGLCEHNFL